MKTCPFCAEQIQDAAVKCRFCNSVLPTAPPTPVALARPPEVAEAAVPPHAPPSTRKPAPAVDSAGDRPQLDRWSMFGITLLLLATCGVGGLYLQYIQNQALKRLNPKAFDAGTVLLLDIVSLVFTAGLLGLFVAYTQTKALADHAESANDPRRNTGIVTLVMVSSVIGLLSMWFGWTGFTLLFAVAFEIYVLHAVHQELVLYTRS